MLSENLLRVPQNEMANVVEIFCNHLDNPAFDPKEILPISLISCRELALVSLRGIAEIPNLSSPTMAPAQDALRRHWLNIRNWMQYFYYEATNKQGSCTPSDVVSMFSFLTHLVITISDVGDVFWRSFLHDGLLVFIVQIWLRICDDQSPFSNVQRLAAQLNFFKDWGPYTARTT